MPVSRYRPVLPAAAFMGRCEWPECSSPVLQIYVRVTRVVKSTASYGLLSPSEAFYDFCSFENNHNASNDAAYVRSE